MPTTKYHLKKNGSFLAYKATNENIGNTYDAFRNIVTHGYYLSNFLQDATVFRSARDAKNFLNQKKGEFWDDFLIVRF